MQPNPAVGAAGVGPGAAGPDAAEVPDEEAGDAA